MNSSKVAYISFLAFHMLLRLPGVQATEALRALIDAGTIDMLEGMKTDPHGDEEDEEDDGPEVFSMLQMPGRISAKKVKKRPEGAPDAPYVVNLRREVVPIYR